MKVHPNSTKTNPILFFESFLKHKEVTIYEEHFYNTPKNPSFTTNKEEGYVEYFKDLYEGGEEVIPVRVYLKEDLKRKLGWQYKIFCGSINICSLYYTSPF